MELRELPRAGVLYGRAVAGVWTRRPDAAPEGALSLRQVAIDRDHLARYDQVCGFRLSDRIPVTYPQVMAFRLGMALMARGDFPFPLIGLVHLRNTIEQRRPIGSDDLLDLTVRAENLRDHDRGRTVDVVTAATVDGSEVWVGRATYLRKEGKGEGRAPGERQEPPTPTAVWRVGSDVGRDYAAASGDRNPIHTSAVGARLFGFPRPIAHGMWSKARCLAALEGRLPEACTVDVSFKLPILLPATVSFSSVREDGWRFALHDAKSGRPHLAGTVH